MHLDGENLEDVLQATFEQRNSPLPTDLPVALTETFAVDPEKKQQGDAFTQPMGPTGS